MTLQYSRQGRTSARYAEALALSVQPYIALRSQFRD